MMDEDLRREPVGDRTEGEAVSAEVYPWRIGVLGGLLGGLAMAIVAALTGLILGMGFWRPLNLVGATLVRDLQGASPEVLSQFLPIALVSGFILHLLLSMGLGVVFVALLPTLPGNKILWSLVIGAFLWAVVLFAVLPIVNPLMSEEVNAPSFLVAHLLYSLVLGYVVERSEPVSEPAVPS